jgi:single-stranded DNA-binding protein
MAINQVFLAGTLDADPQKLTKPNGETVGVRFAIITKERIKDDNEDGGYREVESVNHVRVLDPDSVPELLADFHAGDFICARGLYFCHEWTVGEEKKRAWYVVAQEWGMTLNYAVIKGNLCADPEYKEMGTGGKFKLRSRVATNRRVPDEAKPGDWKDEAIFVNADCFFQGKGKAIADNFKVGDEIAVLGKYVEESYLDRETQQPRTNTYIKIYDFDWGRKRGEGSKKAPDGQPPAYAGSTKAQYLADLDDEIPF